MRINRNNSNNERASSAFSATDAPAIFWSAERSAPEQKSFPAPEITTTLTFSSAAAFCSASLMPGDNRVVQRIPFLRTVERDPRHRTFDGIKNDVASVV